MTNIENEFWEGMNGIFPDIIKAITSLSIKYYNHNVNNPRNRSSEFRNDLPSFINKRTSELLINKMLNAQNPNSKSSDFASKMDQRGVEFFAPLRSAQSRGPPDLVRPCPKTRLRHVLSINKTSSGP